MPNSACVARRSSATVASNAGASVMPAVRFVGVSRGSVKAMSQARNSAEAASITDASEQPWFGGALKSARNTFGHRLGSIPCAGDEFRCRCVAVQPFVDEACRDQ